MEETFAIKAIVLNRLIYREYDSKVLLYAAEQGRFDLIARGTKRPKSKMAGHLEPMSQVNLMVVKGRQYNYVGSAICTNSFPNIKDDYGKLELAGRAFMIFKKNLEPGEPDAELYSLLTGYLEQLNRDNLGGSPLLLYYYFALRFASLLGYSLQIETSCACQKESGTSSYFFDYTAGGLVCKNCANKSGSSLLISQKTTHLLKKMAEISFVEASSLSLASREMKELDKILNFYYQYNLNCRI
jgi:DNA repair protein RecO (recombination protein O)